MSHKSWTTLAIPIVLFFYFTVGVATKWVGELFPIYHWGLFASVQAPVTLVEIYIEEADGQRYTPPVRLQDTEAYQKLTVNGQDVYNTTNVIKRLASAYTRKRYAKAMQLASAFEKNYLAAERVRYTLVRVTFEPTERFRTGEVLSREVIGRFVKGSEE